MTLTEEAKAHLEKMKEHVECCGTPMVRALLDGLEQAESDNDRMRAALQSCAAPFDQSSSPAVAGAMAGADELQKRIKVAVAALTKSERLMPMRFWYMQHQYEVTCVARTNRPAKITVHTGGRRWRTIWRFPEPASELVRAILNRHSLRVGHAEAAKVFTKEKYPLDLRIVAARREQ